MNDIDTADPRHGLLRGMAVALLPAGIFWGVVAWLLGVGR